MVSLEITNYSNVPTLEVVQGRTWNSPLLVGGQERTVLLSSAGTLCFVIKGESAVLYVCRNAFLLEFVRK